MFYIVPMERDIKLHPKYFGPRLLDTVREKLLSEIEGTCSGSYGFVIAVTDIKSYGVGVIEAGRGFVCYSVKFEAVVFRPSPDEVSEVVVSQANKVGMFSEIGPLSCFLSRHSLPPDVEFDAIADPPCYRSKDDTTVFKTGDRLRLRILGTRMNATDIFAIGTVMDDFLGVVSEVSENVT